MKHRQPRPYVPLACAVALAAFVAFVPSAHERAGAQQQQSTPAPTFNPAAPVPAGPPTSVVPPTPSPTPNCGRHHKNCPSPSASSSPEPAATSTPTSPAFATLDGTWEVQLQYINETDYSYLVIAQQPSGTISGVWRVNGKANPFEGTYDGRLIRMQVHLPTGNVTLSGYVEGATDMVGLEDFGNPQKTNIPFTAEHRGNKNSPLKKKS